MAVEALRQLEENLAIARMRRKEPQRVWAARLGVSIPTLIRMEKGEPAVTMGVYVRALWMIGRVQSLVSLADPKNDLGALETEVRAALKRRPVRSTESISARLARKPKPL